MNITEKLVFKPSQIHETKEAIRLDIPALEMQQHSDELLEEDEENAQQRSESHRNEAIAQIDQELEEYRKNQIAIIEEQLVVARKELEEVKQSTNDTAFGIIQEGKEKSKREIEIAKMDAEQLVERSKLEVERMVKEAEMRVSEIEHESYQKGYDAGREVGFKEGEAEVRRLIDRLGTIIGRAIEVREQLIADSEKQMVYMVLMIARKVIKDEISERKKIVLNNIRESLKRIKDRDRIDIRVNFADLELTTAHKDELIKTMETLKKVNIYEDSRIDRGGCIIETDIGSIDARISTQFKQIEEAVRNAEPL